jgi:outer membrane protein assembly factor BamB
LQRIVDELLLSSSGDEALLQLGEVALQRGNYTLARGSWERISPRLRVPPAVAAVLGCDAGCSWWAALRTRQLDELWPRIEQALEQPVAEASWVAYPDTDIPLASVRARLVLLSLLQGDRERARLEADLLGRLHPVDEGEIAGRRGKYVDLIADMLEQSKSWPGTPSSEDWTTLCGTIARNGVAPRTVDVARRPVWQTALPRLEDDDDLLAEGRLRVGERADGLLSYHVAVSRGIAYVLQPGMIRAFQVASGMPAWPFHASARQRQDVSFGAIYQWPRAPRDAIPRYSAHAGVPRYSLTVRGDRLFARMGTAWTGGDESPVRADQRSFLIGIDLPTQKVLFEQIRPGEPGWEFESSPVATDSRMFVALRRRDAASAQVRVACYSIGTGRLVWQRDVLRGEVISGALFEIANSVLTLGDDTLYYNTNLGAVVALRVDDGRPKWVYRYPRSGLRGEDLDTDDRHWARDQTPCLLHRDLVIAAPADSQRIVALDASFGQVVWATAAGVAADAIHLVGVGEGHLIACGDHLYWLDLYSGRRNFQFPAAASPLKDRAGPHPRGFGRAILAGDQVFWPTFEYIYVFRQDSSQQARQPIELTSLGLTGGNLVIDDDTLLIAGADHLSALNRSGRLVQDTRKLRIE